MNTVQNYVGRDSHANTAQKSGQLSPSAVKGQPFNSISLETIEVNKDLFDGHTKLFHLVDDILGLRLGRTPLMSSIHYLKVGYLPLM